MILNHKEYALIARGYQNMSRSHIQPIVQTIDNIEAKLSTQKKCFVRYIRLAFDFDIIYVENHWNQMYHEILSIYSFSFSIVLDAPFFLDTLHYNTQSIHAHSLI